MAFNPAFKHNVRFILLIDYKLICINSFLFEHKKRTSKHKMQNEQSKVRPLYKLQVFANESAFLNEKHSPIIGSHIQ